MLHNMRVYIMAIALYSSPPFGVNKSPAKSAENAPKKAAFSKKNPRSDGRGTVLSDVILLLSGRYCALFDSRFRRIAVHHFSYFWLHFSATTIQYSANVPNVQNCGTAVAEPCKFVNFDLHLRVFAAICNPGFTFLAVFWAFARFCLQMRRGYSHCSSARCRDNEKNAKKPRKARLHTDNKCKKS